MKTEHFGFTLIETVVALAILLAAVVGPVSLITKGLVDFRFAKNRLIAANLAQETIEVIRWIRENNVLCDQLDGSPTWHWDHKPDGPNQPRGNQFGPGSSTWEVDPNDLVSDCEGRFSSPRVQRAGIFRLLQVNPATGVYGYNISGGVNSIFKRYVTVSTPPGSGADSGIPASAQMDVSATVLWQERGVQRSVNLQVRLYDWR